VQHESARGIGVVMVVAGIYMLAKHLGMSRWEAFLVGSLVGLGLGLAISGRWRGW
jgi:hypothetical protein